MMTDGSLMLMVGIVSHGQGMETTLAQIAHEELGVDPMQISVRHGDTQVSAFGMGTFASRSIVMSGGAVAKACRLLREKIARIAAHALKCDQNALRFADLFVGSVSAQPPENWPQTVIGTVPR